MNADLLREELPVTILAFNQIEVLRSLALYMRVFTLGYWCVFFIFSLVVCRLIVISRRRSVILIPIANLFFISPCYLLLKFLLLELFLLQHDLNVILVFS
jgi:hypothetical protein